MKFSYAVFKGRSLVKRYMTWESAYDSCPSDCHVRQFRFGYGKVKSAWMSRFLIP